MMSKDENLSYPSDGSKRGRLDDGCPEVPAAATALITAEECDADVELGVGVADLELLALEWNFIESV